MTQVLLAGSRGPIRRTIPPARPGPATAHEPTLSLSRSKECSIADRAKRTLRRLLASARRPEPWRQAVERCASRTTLYTFPGRAGELQRGSTIELIRELGDNCDTYHDALADEVERVGERPDRAAYGDDYDAFGRAARYVSELLSAEILLRRARKLRKTGSKAGLEVPEAPLVDEAHRLVGVGASDANRHGRRGSREAREWKPPAFSPLPRVERG